MKFFEKQSDIKRFFPYLFKLKTDLAGTLLFGLFYGISTVTTTFLVGRIIDQMIGENAVRFDRLIQLALILGTIYLLSVTSQWLIQYFSNKVAFNAIKDLRIEGFNHLNELPLNFYDQNLEGNTISRFTNDLDSLSDAVSVALNTIFSGFIVLLVSLVFMIYLSPILTLVILVTTPLILLMTWGIVYFSKTYFTNQQSVLGELTGYVSESVKNQRVVTAYHHEEKIQSGFQEINQKLYTWGQKAQFYSSSTYPATRFVDHLTYLAIGVVGGLLVLNGNGNITVGIISSFIIYSAQFSRPFIEFAGLTTQIQTALAGLRRVFEVLDSPKQEKENDRSVTTEELTGSVEFKHVNFSYSKEKPLIQGLDLVVPEGQTVAIVGETGAGKSTLINLLMRFYEVDEGSITVNGLDITDIKRDDLRTNFGMVLQDTWVFNGTILENIQYGRSNVSKEEAIQAAKDALLHNFISKLPKGYDTLIGKGGVNLSAGQQQLLTIARVMLADPPMLILDEATSSVDTLTEVKIQEAFNRIMDGRTSFVIAHRLSTIRNAHTILVMQDGQIVEKGNHKFLLEKEGHYKKLYDMQFV